jgi:broad specificity phosphatase PhoE
MAAATRVYLLRHGAVLHAETRRFIGWLDVPLSDVGRRQCRAQADRLRTVALSAVYSSDLDRSRESGLIIGDPHGLHPRIVGDLREMDMGRWDGLTAEEIERREPAAFRAWMAGVGEFAFPEGEGLDALERRAWPAFERVVSAHAGQAIAVVAHGGTNRVLLCRVLGLPRGRILSLGQDYAALTVLERVGARWTVLRLNERPLL